MMNKEFVVSVIVPIYKVEKYIHKCIDSILNQTYKNLEIILVDDGSPDACPQICDAYARQDERIKVIHQENAGLSAARNAGLDVAQGEYICFVDSDDYVTEKFVEILYVTVKRYNTLLAMCNHVCVNEIGKSLCVKNNIYVKDEIILEKEIHSRVMKKHTHMCVVAWNKIYHKSLWENIRYPVGKVCEDEYIFCKIVSQCEKIACSSMPEYYYRIRSGSITSGKNYKFYNNMIEASKQRLLYYQKKNWRDLEKQCYMSILDGIMMCYCYCFTDEEKNWHKKLLEEVNQYVANHNENITLSNKEKIKLFGCNHLPWLFNYFGMFDQRIRGD